MSAATLSAATRDRITALRDRYPHPRSAILPCLWAVQDEVGWLAPEGMAEVAELLDLAPSEVQAVSTFYSMYFQHPAGAHHVVVCVNAPCALRGADDVVGHLERRLGCSSGSTTADGVFTWEATIECLGACGYAPMMQVDHHFHENLTPEKIDAVLERVAKEPSPHGGGAGHGAVEAHGRASAGPTAPPAGPEPAAQPPHPPKAAPGAGADPATGPGAAPRRRRRGGSR